MYLVRSCSSSRPPTPRTCSPVSEARGAGPRGDTAAAARPRRTSCCSRSSSSPGRAPAHAARRALGRAGERDDGVHHFAAPPDRMRGIAEGSLSCCSSRPSNSSNVRRRRSGRRGWAAARQPIGMHVAARTMPSLPEAVRAAASGERLPSSQLVRPPSWIASTHATAAIAAAARTVFARRAAAERSSLGGRSASSSRGSETAAASSNHTPFRTTANAAISSRTSAHCSKLVSDRRRAPQRAAATRAERKKTIVAPCTAGGCHSVTYRASGGWSSINGSRRRARARTARRAGRGERRRQEQAHGRGSGWNAGASIRRARRARRRG